MGYTDQEWQARLALVELGFGGFREVTLDALKKRYRQLAKQHHPDLGGDAAKMAKINRDYKVALRGFSKT